MPSPDKLDSKFATTAYLAQSVLCIHGCFSTGFQPSRLWDSLVVFMAALGVEPTHGSLDGLDGGKLFQTTKEFRNPPPHFPWRRLPSKLIRLSIAFSPRLRLLAKECGVFVDFSTGFIVVHGDCKFFRPSEELVRQFVRSVRTHLQIEYAYATAMPRSQWAETWAGGQQPPGNINRSPWGTDEPRDNRERWLRFITPPQNQGALEYQRKSLDGVFRDVFRFSVLGEAHLHRDVAGQSFREWVAASPSRGVLSEIEPGLWLWDIDPRFLPDLRDSMSKAGLLIAKTDATS